MRHQPSRAAVTLLVHAAAVALPPPWHGRHKLGLFCHPPAMGPRSIAAVSAAQESPLVPWWRGRPCATPNDRVGSNGGQRHGQIHAFLWWWRPRGHLGHSCNCCADAPLCRDTAMLNIGAQKHATIKYGCIKKGERLLLR